DVDAYLNRPVYAPGYANVAVPGGGTYPMAAPAMTTMYVCPPMGCPVQNPYSVYNGYNGYGGYAMPYPVYVPGVITYHDGYRGAGTVYRSPFHEPAKPRPPQLPGPVGRRP